MDKHDAFASLESALDALLRATRTAVRFDAEAATLEPNGGPSWDRADDAEQTADDARDAFLARLKKIVCE